MNEYIDKERGLQMDIVHMRAGDSSKPNPFTILILSNPALESPLNSGKFILDPIVADKNSFQQTADYVNKSLFGELPDQQEKLFADSPYASKVRVMAAFVKNFLPANPTALVAEDELEKSKIISPRREVVPDMLAYLKFDPDIIFLATKSPTHDRATAYGATDDDNRGGIPFIYDDMTLTHRYYHEIPGMAAIHTTSSALTAVHEFGHAFSSYTNGFVDDLYVDGDAKFNRKVGRPIPSKFAKYRGKSYASDVTRDGLSYPNGWASYHSELGDKNGPAVMDDFWQASGGYVAALHDKLTKSYILDRLAAKVSR